MRHAGWVRALCLAAALAPGAGRAAEANVAVAANFTAAAKEIAQAFEAASGDAVVLSFGSTGQLYAQIAQGAPHDVFLAADDERPAFAVKEGLAVEGTVFTYAVGGLVLWSREEELVTGPEILANEAVQRIAIANPEAAPYGAAAVEALGALGLYDDVKARLVKGNSIAQTYQFVETGNADVGFVASAQLAGNDTGSRWDVDAGLYGPIRQDAVLLEEGRDDPVARAFLDFLRGRAAARIISRHGYSLPAS